ncbi:MAG TPA: protein phosphatase 2C domain-containing protein [Terracidiphilus sp.]|nr:protein phosphatase 2C domain-containing protein [Terracidiphilus sp.]
MGATSIPEAVAIHFASQCDRGMVREENQDCVRQCATSLGDLLIVADGIGGYEGGGVASRMAVDAIAASLESMPAFFPIDIAIEEAVCRANAEIVAAAAEPDTPNNRMGSTVVLALLQQEPGNPKAPVHAWIGHIGDSRAYRLHRRRLSRITRDHSAIQMLLDHDLIAPEEASNHPDASVLTRALGHDPNVKIDLNSIELELGDTLLLCSDGLWGYVSDQEIERVLADPELTAEQASRALLDLALDAGGHDNVGIQLARLAGTGIAAAPREPASAYESPSDQELSFAYRLTSRLRDPFAEPAPQPEIAPQPEFAAQPETTAHAEIAPLTSSEAAPELLSAPAAEPEAAPPSNAGVACEPVLQLESALDGQTLEKQIPEMLIPELSMQELPIQELSIQEVPIHDLRLLGRQPAHLSARNPDSILASESPEPRMTTILGIVAELWEMFKYPLGRDYDFAPEWSAVFVSLHESSEEEGARPQPPMLPTLLARVLVTCAASPQREFENLATQESDLPAQFKNSASEVSTLLKFLGILLLAFCASCGVVYFALFQNWFGIDQILHLL